MMPWMYFDRQGKPITLERWGELHYIREYVVVAKDPLIFGDEAIEVSTVWLGINHFWKGPPMIFETMIFGGPFDQEQWRYSTEEQARQGHQQIVWDLTHNRMPMQREDSNGNDH